MYDGARGGRVTGRGGNLMGKIASVIVAITLATGPLLLPVPAKAENGQIAACVGGGTEGGGVVWGVPAAAPSAPASGVLWAGAGLYRRACLPFRWRALLGRIWLGLSPRPGLRLIAALRGRPSNRI